MTKQTKAKEKTLFEQYTEKKLAYKIQDSYYGIIEGVETFLGKDEQQTTLAIEALLEDGKQLETKIVKPTAPSIQTQESEVEEVTLDEALEQVKSTELEDDVKKAIAEQLSKMTDLKPDTKRGNFIVYVDGVESDRWTDTSIPKNHLVKTIPFVFYWHSKKYNINNGSEITNSGWTVLNKQLAKKMKISVHRDDTPNLPFFTVKDEVLCIARKDQFMRKKTLERLKANMALPKMLAGREEAAKNAALISKTNVQASAQIYSDDMAAVKSQTATNMHVQSNGKMTIEQAQSLLEKADLNNLNQIENQLNTAINTGNLGNNTMVSGQVPENEI